MERHFVLFSHPFWLPRKPCCPCPFTSCYRMIKTNNNKKKTKDSIYRCLAFVIINIFILFKEVHNIK